MKNNKKELIKCRVTIEEKEEFYGATYNKGGFSKAIRLFIKSVITKNRELINQFYN